MTARGKLDDATAEALLVGRLPADREDLAGLGAFVEEIRHAAAFETVEPNEALATVFAEGLDSLGEETTAHGDTAEMPRPTSRRATRDAPGPDGILARTGARVAIAVAATVIASAGVGVSGLLPEPVNDVMTRAVESITPFGSSDGDDTGASGAPDDAGTQGAGTEGGEEAPAGPRPDDRSGVPEAVDGWWGRPRVDGRPPFPGQHGRDRAADTPAGEQVPVAPGPPGDVSDDPGPPGDAPSGPPADAGEPGPNPGGGRGVPEQAGPNAQPGSGGPQGGPPATSGTQPGEDSGSPESESGAAARPGEEQDGPSPTAPPEDADDAPRQDGGRGPDAEPPPDRPLDRVPDGPLDIGG